MINDYICDIQIIVDVISVKHFYCLIVEDEGLLMLISFHNGFICSLKLFVITIKNIFTIKFPDII